MAAAIKTMFPGTRHRWCRWHVLRKAKQKIGTPYSKKSGFKKKFNKHITDEISPSVFEKKWQELVDEYKLQENSFMTRAYQMRGMWAKPYFMDNFCAGMTSTQRSESANHMLKRFIQRSAPMHVFVSKFRDFQFDRNQEEEREVHLTKQMSRRMRIGVPIERHSEAVYTREMHEKFYNELYKSGAFTIVDKSTNGQRFTLVHIDELGAEDARKYDVILIGTDEIKCSCGLYEHAGLPCRHCLKVLVHLDRTQIPKGNIKHRWTKEADKDGEEAVESSLIEHVTAHTDEMKRRVLVMKALELSQTKGPIDDEAYTDAIRAMESIVPCRQSSIETNISFAADDTCEVLALSHDLPIACPTRMKRTGRPRDTSLKSWKKHYKLEKDTRRKEEESTANGEDNKEGTRPTKTRRLADLMHVT